MDNLNSFPNPKSMPGARPMYLHVLTQISTPYTKESRERSILKTSCKNNLSLQKKCWGQNWGPVLSLPVLQEDVNPVKAHSCRECSTFVPVLSPVHTISALPQTRHLPTVTMIISPLRGKHRGTGFDTQMRIVLSFDVVRRYQ